MRNGLAQVDTIDRSHQPLVIIPILPRDRLFQ
jgi:hypothetical protein